MKKFILMLLVVLLMPVTVLAETCHADGVTIESIEMIEKSEGSKELSPAKANGTSMDLDISFTREKDYIIYKVVIKNNTENDYVLDEAMFTKNYNNVSYKFETDNKLVKAGNVRELSLRVELISVPENGHYSEKNTLDLNLTGGAIENPPTGVKSLLYVIPVLLIIGFLVVFTAKKKTSFKAMALIVGLLVSIPTIVNAVCKCNLKVNSTITVSNCKYKLITDKGTFEDGKDVKDICVGANEVSDSSEFICKGFAYYNEYDAAANFDDDDNTTTITEATSFGDTSISPKMLTMRPAYAYLLIYNYMPLEPLFNDKSYIKVYSDYEKKNLIKTITKNDIDGHYYVLEKNKYLDNSVLIPLGEYDEVYFTVSRDLYNKIDIDIRYQDPENYHEDSCPAGSPVITSSIVIDKIQSMIYSVDDEDQTFYGFSNCQDKFGRWVMKPSNNYVTRVFESSGLRRSPLLRGTLVVAPSQITCAGNEYHAVWKYGDAGDK